MKIYLLALCILLNITSSILFCIENKSLEWQIIEVFLNLGILLVLGFLFMGEGFLWVIWKFYNEKPWNAWLLVILFITMLLFRNEYLNNAIFAELVILFPKLILLLDDGANFQDDSIKEFFRWAQILLIPSSFSGLLRIMLRPFTVVFCVFCNFAMHYVVLTFNPRPANKSFCLNFNTLFGLLRICTNCRRIFTGLYWCQNCGKKYFTDNFSKWTSGNDHIDESIRDTQKKAIDTTDYIEWIPYSELGDMKRIDEGGFGTIYYTIWKCGGPLTMLRGKIERLWQSLEENNRELGHLDEELSKNLRQHKVAIKILKHSDTNTIEKFVKELKAYIKCVTTLHTNDFQKVIVRCYGISQDPTTGNYMFVMKLERNGNLRQYLKKKFSVLKWYNDKLKILANIANGLKAIHEAGLVHRDLHAGNILIGDDGNACITDLGLSCFENEETSKLKYGVLPFIDPEILRNLENHKYTFTSDVYSFGIIMWMLTSGQSPFADYEYYDHLLQIKICKGERPDVNEEIPKCYRELIERCWNSDPSKRPLAIELYNTIKLWRLGKCYRQFKNADRSALREISGQSDSLVLLSKESSMSSCRMR